MDINKLNDNYGVSGRVEFITGNGGSPFIKIHNQNASALIALHGAQILSFKPHEQTHNMLFLSQKAWHQEGKSVHGGIPVCWPWFGPDPIGLQRPNHGFARDNLWEAGEVEDAEAETRITLRFSEQNKKEKTWKQPFLLTLDFTIGTSLSLKMSTRNTGDKPFTITEAFHAYFHIGDISRVRVWGLENRRYYDKLDQGQEKRQTGTLTVGEEVDRIYEEAGNPLIISDPVLDRRIELHSENCKNAVVWNPWHKRFSDLEADDYREFVCVETGNMAFDKVIIAPGEEHSIGTTFSILPL